MVEAIHAAAFANNTLGLPKMCPEGNVDSAINRAILINFLRSYHTPERMVLAGVGVDHDKLVEAAQVFSIFDHCFMEEQLCFSNNKKKVFVCQSGL